jgi:hypothetical protein
LIGIFLVVSPDVNLKVRDGDYSPNIPSNNPKKLLALFGPGYEADDMHVISSRLTIMVIIVKKADLASCLFDGI